VRDGLARLQLSTQGLISPKSSIFCGPEAASPCSLRGRSDRTSLARLAKPTNANNSIRERYCQISPLMRHGSCKVQRDSILSSRSTAQAYRRVRLKLRNLSKPASFDWLRMLVSGLSSDFARALVAWACAAEESQKAPPVVSNESMDSASRAPIPAQTRRKGFSCATISPAMAINHHLTQR